MNFENLYTPTVFQGLLRDCMQSFQTGVVDLFDEKSTTFLYFYQILECRTVYVWVYVLKLNPCDGFMVHVAVYDRLEHVSETLEYPLDNFLFDESNHTFRLTNDTISIEFHKNLSFVKVSLTTSSIVLEAHCPVQYWFSTCLLNLRRFELGMRIQKIGNNMSNLYLTGETQGTMNGTQIEGRHWSEYMCHTSASFFIKRYKWANINTAEWEIYLLDYDPGNRNHAHSVVIRNHKHGKTFFYGIVPVKAKRFLAHNFKLAFNSDGILFDSSKIRIEITFSIKKLVFRIDDFYKHNNVAKQYYGEGAYPYEEYYCEGTCKISSRRFNQSFETPIVFNKIFI